MACCACLIWPSDTEALSLAVVAYADLLGVCQEAHYVTNCVDLEQLLHFRAYLPQLSFDATTSFVSSHGPACHSLALVPIQ
jgi:hypothetical protein